eukprot:TRINITY_DN11166_c0_g1_i7.p2 TRINITY_DN11166_c0_g1~~TRINITY_DN11166_c0_g1_i7.p2  ORF type:complete len:190 (+),score=30.11 TRINITY_DN11166_c0_g1_i7:1337-1906(+)
MSVQPRSNCIGSENLSGTAQRQSSIIQQLFVNNREPQESVEDDFEEHKVGDVSIQDKLKMVSAKFLTSQNESNDSSGSRTLRINPLDIAAPICLTERINYTDIIKPNIEIRITESRADRPNCALCFDKATDAVLMECGHGGICFCCARKLLRLHKSCPLCRKPVSLVLRIDIEGQYGVFVKVIESLSRP